MRTLGKHYHGETPGRDYPVECSTCGAPWPRSELRSDGDGRLQCPVCFGPSYGDLVRGNARKAGRPQARARIDAPVHRGGIDPTPLTLFGSVQFGGRLHAWFKASAPDVKQSSSLASTWSSPTGTGRLEQSDAALQPTYASAGIGTAPALSGSGSQWMVAPLTALPVGCRPYMWVVAKANSTAANATIVSMNSHNRSASPMFVAMDVDSGRFRGHIFGCSDSAPDLLSEVIEGPIMDTGAHLFELGMLDTLANKFIVDGTAYNDRVFSARSYTGAHLYGFNRLHLFRLSDASVTFANFSVSEIAITTEPPTSSEKVSMREYYEGQAYGLTIA